MSSSLTITDGDVDRFLKLVIPDSGADLGQPLQWSLLQGLTELIPSDEMSFFDLDSSTESTTFDQSLPLGAEARRDGYEEQDQAFWRHYWDCESCCYPDRSGDVRSVTKISDFYSDNQWHETGMYQEYIGTAGFERELMLCLPGGPNRTLRLIFLRGPGSDFTERERGLLTLLRPHLHEAYLDADRRSRGIPDLTQRQWELMRLVAIGYSNKQIARRLFISEGTVRKHLENVFERLDVTNRMAAVEQAFPARLA